MDIEKISKDLEEIYENCCHIKREDKDEYKCLALDEQELALIHMCIEIMGSKNGYNKNNYTSKGLFIILKNNYLGNNECKEDKVAEQPIKYKKFEYINGYSIENASNLFLAYYGVLIFYANGYSTSDFRNKSQRNYFKVYAFFACICSKTFNILLFNQIYLFMHKAHNCSLVALKQYLMNTEELWLEYNRLMNAQERNNILGKLHGQFREIIAYDEETLYACTSKIYELCDEDFLAFDFMKGDTIPKARYSRIINGIEYFKCYLFFLKYELKEKEIEDCMVFEQIENILNNAIQLDDVFCQLINNSKCELIKTTNFINTDDLIKKFEKYCEEESIELINI